MSPVDRSARRIIKFVIMAFLVCLCTQPGCGPTSEERKEVGVKPYNVILISVDTLRADYLSSYGRLENTAPNIDKFADKSIVFTNSRSQSPWTTPSHASMFTSMYPSVLNIGRWPNPGRFNQKAQTLAELLRKNGFKTAGFLEGGGVRGQLGFNQGFDLYKQDFRHIEQSIPKCLTWIEENKENHFFVFLHTYDVHRYDPPEEYYGTLMPEYNGNLEKGIPLAKKLQNIREVEFRNSLDDSDKDRITSIYRETLLYVDHWLGKLFENLEHNGLLKNTIVIFTSDHGEEFFEHGRTGHGYTNFKEQLNIPLIIYHPDIPAGKRKEMVGLIDLPPSVAEMLGLSCPRIWQGKSFFQILKGRKQDGFELNFAENGHAPRKSVETLRWKLIRTYKSKEDFSKGHTDQLFNLINDPQELTDLSKTRAKVFKTMKKLLEEWIGGNDKRKNNFDIIKIELNPKVKKQLNQLGYTGDDNK